MNFPDNYTDSNFESWTASGFILTEIPENENLEWIDDYYEYVGGEDV